MQKSLDISGHPKITNFHGRVVQNQLLLFEHMRESYSHFRPFFFSLEDGFGFHFGSKLIPKSIQDHFDEPKRPEEALKIDFEARKTHPRPPKNHPRPSQEGLRRLQNGFGTDLRPPKTSPESCQMHSDMFFTEQASFLRWLIRSHRAINSSEFIVKRAHNRTKRICLKTEATIFSQSSSWRHFTHSCRKTAC